jgi:nicotinamide mononucleotide transporter
MIADLLHPLNKVAVELAGAPTTVAELLGFISGAACVWLVVKQNVWTFPVGIANAILFGILFVDARLYADAALQVMYLVLQVVGWWAWLRTGPDGTTLRVTRGWKGLAWALGGVVAITAILTPVLRSTGDAAPLLDAHTTALSLGAQALLTFKRLENWWLWIAADVIYIPLYASRGLMLTAIVYVVFLIMCVVGYREWSAAARAPVTARRPSDDELRPALSAART